MNATGFSVTVDALETLKIVGIAYGVYDHAEDLRDCRVTLENGERPALVVQEDVSLHGSPFWETVRTICAPLRGEVEKNIAFARDKAREVFAAGNVPICPHLMFPPIADPENPAQDQAAREMGLRLVESCQQVNVYGPVWTEGMWAEINHAERLGIPVLTDQKELGKPPRRRTKQGKER